MISLLPARVVKLLEFIGFSGDKVIILQSYIICYEYIAQNFTHRFDH